jgi:hypothetical protein
MERKYVLLLLEILNRHKNALVNRNGTRLLGSRGGLEIIGTRRSVTLFLHCLSCRCLYMLLAIRTNRVSQTQSCLLYLILRMGTLNMKFSDSNNCTVIISSCGNE